MADSLVIRKESARQGRHTAGDREVGSLVETQADSVQVAEELVAKLRAACEHNGSLNMKEVRVL